MRMASLGSHVCKLNSPWMNWKLSSAGNILTHKSDVWPVVAQKLTIVG